MALDLGSLYGTIDIKDAPFQKGLDRAFDALGNFAGSAGKLAATAGAAVGAAFAVSLVQNISAEAANDKLAAQLGLNEAEAQRAGSVAGELYSAAYGDSMEQVNDAVAAVMGSIDGMREASAADLEDITAKALDLADAFEFDIGRSSQIAGQLISSGLAADATEAFDLITLSAQKVTPALREDLLDAIDEYGPSFAQLGFSGEAAFAMLVDSSAKGMYGIDKTGDAIKEFALLVSTDLARTQPVIESLGLDYGDMANKLLAGGEQGAQATSQIVEALLGTKDPAAQARAAVELFGTPIEDLNTGQIPEFLTSLQGLSTTMDETAGAGDRFGDKLNGNAASSLESLKRQAQVAFMGLANWALPTFSAVAATAASEFGPALQVAGDVLAWLGGIIQSTFGFLAEHQTTVSIVAGVITAVLLPALIAWGVQSTIAGGRAVAAWVLTKVGAIQSAALQVVSLTLITVGWIRLGITSMINGVKNAAAWIMTAGPAITAGVAHATTFALMIAGWIAAGVGAMAGAAVMAASWLVAIWPIALVVAAIAGVVALVVIYWDEIKAFTAAAWDWVVGLIRGAIDWIVQIFLNFTGPGLIIKHWDTIKSTVSAGVGAVVGFVTELPGKVTNALTGAKDWLVGVGEDVMNGLIAGIDNGLDWVADKLSGVGKLIPGWLKDVLGISSPSKVMRDQVGVWIPAGIADGITAGIPAVQAAMDDLVNIPDVTVGPTSFRSARVQGGDGAALGQGAPGPTFQVFPSAGMDEEAVGRAAWDRYDASQMGPT